jgi:hypothetical protein
MSSVLSCIPVIKCERGPFYLVDGFKYHLNFPLAWATNHLSWEKNTNVISGPKFCENCKNTGCVQGVFVCYCLNCQQLIYNGKRMTPIDGIEVLPPASYHWQMDVTSKRYGLDKEFINESGVLPPVPLPSSPPLPSPVEKILDEIDLSDDLSVFDFDHTTYLINKRRRFYNPN